MVTNVTHATCIDNTNTNTNANAIYVDAIIVNQIPIKYRIFGILCVIMSLTFFALIISACTFYYSNSNISNLSFLICSVVLWMITSLVVVNYYNNYENIEMVDVIDYV